MVNRKKTMEKELKENTHMKENIQKVAPAKATNMTTEIKRIVKAMETAKINKKY